MNHRQLQQQIITIVLAALLLVGCSGQLPFQPAESATPLPPTATDTPKYVFTCTINKIGFRFDIAGETGRHTTTYYTDRSSHYEKDPSGQGLVMVFPYNEDWLFENSKHKYHIEGTLNLINATLETTYDLVATGDAFDNLPQACKGSLPIATQKPEAELEPTATPESTTTPVPPTPEPVATLRPNVARITGVLIDENSQKPISYDVAVRLVNFESEISKLHITRREPCAIANSGNFAFYNIPSGKYILSVLTSTDCRAYSSGSFLQHQSGGLEVIEYKAGQTIDLGKVTEKILEMNLYAPYVPGTLNRHDPVSVLIAYFHAWKKGDRSAQMSFLDERQNLSNSTPLIHLRFHILAPYRQTARVRYQQSAVTLPRQRLRRMAINTLIIRLIV